MGQEDIYPRERQVWKSRRTGNEVRVVYLLEESRMVGIKDRSNRNGVPWLASISNLLRAYEFVSAR